MPWSRQRAILHLHDRDWVYVPTTGSKFRRVEVVGGKMLPGNMQEVTGIQPGQQVVANALVLQFTRAATGLTDNELKGKRK